MTITNHKYAEMTSPTFVAEFADGLTTRMSCYTPDNLDPARGIKLSLAAYESRMKKSPPAIVKASFVKPFSDETTKSYDRTELKALQPSTAEAA